MGRLDTSIAAGKYRLRAQLGEGAHGMVYRARHVDLGRDVALKLLKPGVARDDDRAQKRFLREVHLATSFVHRYAVTLRDFGREGGLLYYTMDLVEGKTLQAALKDEPVFELRRGVTLALQILEALEEAHRAGVIHRDLKPGNLMLTHGPEGEEVRILDFGLAKAVRAQGEDLEGQLSQLTVAGARVGTLAYMSPEQAMGRDLDARSDLYAVGVILYMCLSGGRPCFPKRDGGDPLQAFLFNLTSRKPQPASELNPQIPRSVCALVSRALAKKPGDRFPDARAFRDALAQALEDEDAGRGERSSERRGGLGAKRSSSSGSRIGPALSGRRSSGYRLPSGIVHGVARGEFVNEVDGQALVYVPPGTFLMGYDRAPPRADAGGLPGRRKVLGRERPVHRVTITQGYFLGKTPVTWRHLRRFCIENGHQAPRTVDFRNLAGFDITDLHPAVNVDFETARAYCAWAGGRLPSEAEWEFAARGEDSSACPWGPETIDPRLGNWAGHPLYGKRATSPVGSFPRGHSPTGCLDMVGNVWEWTHDHYGEFPSDDQVNPSGRGRKGRSERVARGGSWRDAEDFCTATSRLPVSPKARLNWLGFRLCLSAAV